MLAPAYQLPRDMLFDLEHSPQGFRLLTNLNLREINQAHQASFPGSEAQITFALLLDTIHSARGDLFLAARHSAELVTSPLSSAVVTKRLQRTASNMIPAGQLDQVRLFQDEILSIGSVREAINSKERSVKELVELVEAAERFRGWLQGVPPESRLIREYIQAITLRPGSIGCP